MDESGPALGSSWTILDTFAAPSSSCLDRLVQGRRDAWTQEKFP